MIRSDSISFDALSIVRAGRTLRAMTIGAIRHQNLCWLLKHRFGGVQARLADAIGRNPNQARFLLNPEGPGGRWMGEKVARDIEKRLGLDPNSMDLPNGLAGGYNEQLTPAQLQVRETVAEYLAQLNDEDAGAVSRFIEAMANRK